MRHAHDVAGDGRDNPTLTLTSPSPPPPPPPHPHPTLTQVTLAEMGVDKIGDFFLVDCLQCLEELTAGLAAREKARS